jgi:holo-[acyl-carrier protein] synthase
MHMQALAEGRHQVGLDVVSVQRLESLLTEHATATAELFTPGEIAYAHARRRPMEHLASRFAAKEAAFKALGVDPILGPAWLEIEVDPTPSGRPMLRLRGETLRWAQEAGVREIDVSITHGAGLAVANVLVVFETPRSLPD